MSEEKIKLPIFIKFTNNKIFTSKHLNHKFTTKVNHKSVITVKTTLIWPCVLGILLQALYILTHFTLSTPCKIKYYYHQPHLTDGETGYIAGQIKKLINSRGGVETYTIWLQMYPLCNLLAVRQFHQMRVATYRS